jgi:hypothetical protein
MKTDELKKRIDAEPDMAKKMAILFADINETVNRHKRGDRVYFKTNGKVVSGVVTTEAKDSSIGYLWISVHGLGGYEICPSAVFKTEQEALSNGE